jgi:ABC-type multidrug transport system fused ATPase/permease subunit
MNKNEETSNFGWRDMLRSLWYLLDDQKQKYLFLSAIVFLVQFYELVPTVIVGKIVDFFTTYKPGDSLTAFYQYVAILGIGTATVALIRLSSKRGLSTIQTKTAYLTRVKGFEKLLDFSIKWHDKENTGNKVQKIQSGTGVLRDLQHKLSNDLYYNTATIIGVLSSFVIISPQLFLLALAYLASFILVQVRFYKITHKLIDEYNQLVEQASGSYYEGLSNVLTLKTLGVQKDFGQSIINKEALTRNHSFNMIRIGNNKWKVFQLVNAIFLVLALLLIGRNFLLGIITTGSIFIFYNFFAKMQTSIGFSTELVEDFISYKVSLGRMMPIYWEKSSAIAGDKPFPNNWSNISIANGFFEYKDLGKEKSALSNINLTIKRYEKVGIVGKSGSGKSTLAKILLGLYPLKDGRYEIGETNYFDIMHEEVSKNVSLVLQDSEMFNMTLRDNITLMREYDEELFQEAVTIAQLNDLITVLPNGLDTLIGEKGYRLSGGERQRIGIARAIYKDPQILVLDEATSSLDTSTETKILEAIEEKLKKKTLIMIAHRVTTLKNVDRIYVFDQGKIVEEGTYEKLFSNSKSKFSQLSRSKIAS